MHTNNLVYPPPPPILCLVVVNADVIRCIFSGFVTDLIRGETCHLNLLRISLIIRPRFFFWYVAACYVVNCFHYGIVGSSTGWYGFILVRCPKLVIHLSSPCLVLPWLYFWSLNFRVEYSWLLFSDSCWILFVWWSCPLLTAPEERTRKKKADCVHGKTIQKKKGR